MRTVGVVTGSRLEARCLSGIDARIVCSGADAGRARLRADELIEQGVRGLVSFGLAGALYPDLRPGALLLPAVVITPDGERIEADAPWRARLDAVTRSAQLRPRSGAVAGSDELIATADEKAGIYRRSGALAIDMESHAVARAARAAGLPFLVIRAIADPAGHALPDVARVALDGDGRMRLRAMVLALLLRPHDLPALLGLARQSRAGLRTLRRVALPAGPALGLG